MEKIYINKLNGITSLENFLNNPPIMHDIFSVQISSNIKLLKNFNDYFTKQLNDIEYNTASNYIKSEVLKILSREYNNTAKIKNLEDLYFNADLRPDYVGKIRDLNCEEYYSPVIDSIDEHNNELNEYAFSRAEIITKCKNWLAENAKDVQTAEKKISKYDKTASKNTRAYHRVTNKLKNAKKTDLYDTMMNIFLVNTTMELENMIISHLGDTVDNFKKLKVNLINKVEAANKSLETKSEQEKIAELQEVEKYSEPNSYDRMQDEGY